MPVRIGSQPAERAVARTSCGSTRLSSRGAGVEEHPLVPVVRRRDRHAEQPAPRRSARPPRPVRPRSTLRLADLQDPAAVPLGDQGRCRRAGTRCPTAPRGGRRPCRSPSVRAGRSARRRRVADASTGSDARFAGTAYRCRRLLVRRLGSTCAHAVSTSATGRAGARPAALHLAERVASSRPTRERGRAGPAAPRAPRPASPSR